jgi:3-oxoacyl-[acyl-carrier-protein] synthase II
MAPFAAAVTGIGLVTPAGIGVAANWARVTAGETAAAVDPALADLPVHVSCRVPDFAPKDHGLRGARQWDRYTTFAMLAAKEALSHAGLDPADWDGTRVAVVLGSGAGGTLTLEEQHRTLLVEGPGDVSPQTLPMGLLNMAAGQVAIAFGARGPCLAPCTACASGASAIGIGRDLLRLGAADIVIAGGAEAPISPLYVSSFARMRALSRNPDPATASRPFDSARDGFVLGEGAGVLVLESEDHALARGVRPVAKVIGYGASADAHHVTQPHPDGMGARLAMTAALADAHVAGSEVRHVNAHGTSTVANDRTESAVIRDLLGPDAQVTSTKGVTGHLLGAGASVEAAYTALTVRHGIVPPTANLTDPEPGLDIDIVFKAARQSTVEVAVSDSFGFGGQNVCLVIAS